MGVELTIDITDAQRKLILRLLKKHLPNTAAWVYGSRATWNARPQSDLDMVVFTTSAQERRVSDLRDAFEESALPFRVELFVWDAVPESFHGQIEAEHVVLAEKDDLRACEQWRPCTWGELATLEYGKALRDYRSAKGPYPVFGTNGPIGWHTDRLDAGPGVIVGRKGAYRGVHYASGPFSVIDTAFYLKPKVPMDVRWAYYELLTHDINGLDSGSAIPSTSREDFYGLPVRVPPLPEQHTIAHILGTLDDKIELNRRMNETLEAMSRALFKSWFVDFDPVHAKAALKHHVANRIPRQGDSTRSTKAAPSDHSPLEGESARQGRQPAVEPVGGNQTPLPLLKGGDWTAKRAQVYLDGMEAETAALFPDSFTASELGPIPAGWDIRPLAECIDIIRGLSYNGSKLAATGLLMHNLNSIYEGGGYKQAGIKYYAGDFKARHTTRPGDLLVANTEQGHDRLLIGYAAIVPSRSDATSLFSHHLYRLRLRPLANLTPDYLCHLLNTQRMHDRVSSYATGTTVNMLPLDALRLPRVAVPCGPLVTAFDRAAKAARERQEQIVEEVHTLTALRDTLLPKLVSGELRIDAPQGFSTEFHDG